MNTYELMCCYKSPNWFNYQNPLSPQYDYCHEKIEMSLPESVVDSYLGRLVDLAKVVNREVVNLNKDNLDEWLDAMPIFYATGVFRGHLPRPQSRQQLQAFFDFGFPAEWIQPLLQVFILELWTGSSLKTKLNDKKFLHAVRELEKCTFQPICRWFQSHPNATDEKTSYVEEEEECLKSS